MAKLYFDARAVEILSRVKANPDSAAQALLLAAEYIRSRDPLPDDLAEYLAGAIEAAMHKPKEMRCGALLLELNLKKEGPIVDATWYEVGLRFEALLKEGKSQNSASTIASEEFEISESTATRRWREYLRHRKAHDQALRDSDIDDAP